MSVGSLCRHGAETEDALQTAWSRIFSNWEALTDEPEFEDHLRQTILRMAIRGRLVARDEFGPGARQILEELRAEREQLIADRTIRRRAALPPIHETEEPFRLPKTWIWVRLDDVGEWGAGTTPKRSESRYFGGSHNWFKSGELNDLPALAGPSDQMVTDAALEECSLRLNRKGDVLLAMYGATIGRTAILAGKATTNQAVCACTCFSGFDNEFLFLFLQAWRREFVQLGAGGAQPNISREKIVRSPVPLPPLPEQRRIVYRANELLGLVAELGDRLRRKEAAATALVNSLSESMLGGAQL